MTSLPKNIYEQQASNRRNTWLVMLLFALFFAFLGYGFDWFVLHTHYPIAAGCAFVIGGLSAIWGLYGGASAVLSAAGAVPVDESDEKYQQLRNVVEEMSIAGGTPRPALYVIADPDPNAFATGRDPDHAAVAVTEGLLEQLNRDELQAVIAHEMSHVRNYDIRLMTVVAALGGAVLLLSEFAMRSGSFGGGGRRRSRDSSDDKDSGAGTLIFFVIWLIALILSPLIVQILSLMVSRQREYLADASGAELTRNPGALANALEKIDSAVEPTQSIKRGTAHLCIADPIGRAINSREGMFSDLFATHPPIAKRIEFLRGAAYETAGKSADV